MNFENSYDKIAKEFSDDSEIGAITFSDDLKSFLSKNIKNISFSCHNGNKDTFLEYIPDEGQSIEQGYDFFYSRYLGDRLVFVPKNQERMSNIVDRRDSVLQLNIYGNEYGETKIIKEYINNNGAFSEDYDIDERKIVTEVYNINDASRLYHEFDKEFTYPFTNQAATILYRFSDELEPMLKIEARVRGKFFVIDAGDEHVVIPREDSMTLYSVYYDYMVSKGYYFADDKQKNIKR